MGFNVAKRTSKKLRISVSGQSGAGKTKSSLRIAYGLTGDWSKIGVVDTEQASASLYADMGPFLVSVLTPPFEPKKFLTAINDAVAGGLEVLIIDSITHEWAYCRELADKLQQGGKNKFTVWGQVTPMHDAFVQGMLQAPLHILVTMRSKTDWVIEQNDKGKQAPRKVGLKDDQREGMEYEFDVAFKLSREHLAECDKDRTQLFSEKMPFELTEDTGKALQAWANSGEKVPTRAEIPYDNKDQACREWLRDLLNGTSLDQKHWKEVVAALEGRPCGEAEAITLTIMQRHEAAAAAVNTL